MRYKWEPTWDEENGWYVSRDIYMNPAETYKPGKFETYDSEEEAQGIADYLNKKENVEKTVEKKT